MKYRVGERLKMVRVLLGLTQPQFAEHLGIDFLRVKNCEQLKIKVSETEYDALAIHYPELFPFFAHEGVINSEELRASKNARSRLIMSKFDAGDLNKNPARKWIK